MKSPDDVGYELHISSVEGEGLLTPENLPMGVLAKYLEQLSSLIGGKHYQDQLIVKDIVSGSACVQVALRSKPQEIQRTFQEQCARNDDHFNPLREELFRQGHKADLVNPSLDWRTHLSPLDPDASDNSVYQEEEYLGQVIKIGGRDKTIPLQLRGEDDLIYNLTLIDPELAKDISRYYLGQAIICYGDGQIKCNQKGQWLPVSQKFIVRTFKAYEPVPIDQWVQGLCELPIPYGHYDNPLVAWEAVRKDGQ